MKKLILVFALILSATSFVFAQATSLLMRTPTLNKTHIVFSYAGDLWAVARDGGEASRLTTGVGREFSPQFSPDGQWIAFTGEYDGNVDIYVMPAAGGVPRRLTYHPGADQLSGWTPDGKSVLFVSGRQAESGRTAPALHVAVDGVPDVAAAPMAYEVRIRPTARASHTCLAALFPGVEALSWRHSHSPLHANLGDRALKRFRALTKDLARWGPPDDAARSIPV